MDAKEKLKELINYVSKEEKESISNYIDNEPLKDRIKKKLNYVEKARSSGIKFQVTHAEKDSITIEAKVICSFVKKKDKSPRKDDAKIKNLKYLLDPVSAEKLQELEMLIVKMPFYELDGIMEVFNKIPFREVNGIIEIYDESSNENLGFTISDIEPDYANQKFHITIEAGLNW